MIRIMLRFDRQFVCCCVCFCLLQEFLPAVNLQSNYRSSTSLRRCSHHRFPYPHSPLFLSSCSFSSSCCSSSSCSVVPSCYRRSPPTAVRAKEAFTQENHHGDGDILEKQLEQLEEIKRCLLEKLRYVEPTFGLGISKETTTTIKQLVRDLELHSVGCGRFPRFPESSKACQGLWRLQYSSVLSPVGFNFIQTGAAAASLRPLNIYQNIHTGTSLNRLDNVLELMFPSILSQLPFFNASLPSLVDPSERARLHIAHDQTTILPHRYLPYAFNLKKESSSSSSSTVPSPSPPREKDGWLFSAAVRSCPWLKPWLGAVHIPYGVSNVLVGGDGGKKFYRTFDTIYVDDELRITTGLQGDIGIFTKVTEDTQCNQNANA
eukprot:GHVS01027346.1.p1 GENE.GHVS01027346.1~~GHVS01027346.1.p1  ORF type:complete len:376 (+),score=69.56 GHVS01027346.1:320-1447(+)